MEEQTPDNNRYLRYLREDDDVGHPVTPECPKSPGLHKARDCGYVRIGQDVTMKSPDELAAEGLEL